MESIDTHGSSGPEEALTFSWLHNRVKDYSASTRRTSSRAELLLLGTGIAMAVLGLSVVGVGAWLPSRFVEMVAMVCLVLEVTAFVLYVGMTLRSDLPQFTRPREVHASELDTSFGKWQALMVEVRRFPRAERESRLRFVLALRQRMADRIGLVYGGLQHLGIYPLLIAFYLQLRNWKWGDWASAFDVNPVAAFLILMMVGMYLIGWLLVGLRTRVDLYVTLLEESMQGGGKA